MDFAALFAVLCGEVGWLPAVLGWLGLVVVTAQSVVVLTPTKKDNKFVAKLFEVPVLGMLLKALASFAPVLKKPKSG